MATIQQTKVDNFFMLDNGKTYRILEQMSQMLTGLSQDFHPRRANSWYGENPFTLIANDDNLWETYTSLCPGQVTLAGFFESLAISQFFILNNKRGPEGDGALQMLRKHWYNWAKQALQPAAARLGTGLMDPDDPNSPPDSEKLYDLMSKTFGAWNKEGLLEYRAIWVENGSTQFFQIDSYLPEPYDLIVICCEKDAALQGVYLSGRAMGARAVYSGGGKSSRSGIEKLYYQCLEAGVQAGRTVYVLVISDWDTDGESVIAPAFVEQLSTYVPRDQLEWKRVGINPDQLAHFGYRPQEKWYEVKYQVGGSSNANYLQWCKEKALFDLRPCQTCGIDNIAFGAICPSCGSIQGLPDSFEDEECLEILNGKGAKNGGKKQVEDWKQRYIDFYRHVTPRGFELDAFTRLDYCELLVEGLAELIDWDDLCDVLSDAQLPSEYTIKDRLSNNLLEANAHYQELDGYITRLEEWFNKTMADLRDTRQTYINEAAEKAQELYDEHVDDDEQFADDPDCKTGGMIEHMRRVRPDQSYITPFNPFDSWRRARLLTDHIVETETGEIQDFAEIEHPYTQLDLGDE